jgi:hypothetical protein
MRFVQRQAAKREPCAEGTDLGALLFGSVTILPVGSDLLAE